MEKLNLPGLAPGLAERIEKESVENDSIYGARSDATLDWGYLHYGHSYMLRWALGQFPSLAGCRILDVGAGDGFSSIMLAKSGAVVSAIDVSAAALRRIEKLAKLNHQAIEVRLMAGECLDYPDRVFDGVLCISAFHHMDLDRACSEFGRVLKPGGKLVLIEPLYSNPPAWIYRQILQIGERTSEERPLRKRDFRCLNPSFEIATYKGMFLLTLPLMAIDRLCGKRPSVVRATGKIFRWLSAADERLASLPVFERVAWKMGVTAIRREDAGSGQVR